MRRRGAEGRRAYHRADGRPRAAPSAAPWRGGFLQRRETQMRLERARAKMDWSTEMRKGLTLFLRGELMKGTDDLLRVAVAGDPAPP